MALLGGLLEGNWALGMYVGAVFGLFGGPYFAARMREAGLDDGSLAAAGVPLELRDPRVVIALVVVLVAGGMIWLTSGTAQTVAVGVSWFAGVAFLLFRRPAGGGKPR